MAVSQVVAPGLEVGVDVEAGLRRRDDQPGGGAHAGDGGGDGGVQGAAGRDALADRRGFGEGQGGGCWTGAAGADQISLPAPSRARRSRSPSGPAGIRATPIRQPPSARLLLSPVVITVRSGATWAGLRTGAAGSCTRSR